MPTPWLRYFFTSLPYGLVNFAPTIASLIAAFSAAEQKFKLMRSCAACAASFWVK